MKVRVLNDNVHPFKTIYKGDPVEIEAKGYWLGPDKKPLVLDIFEANEFRAQYHPITADAAGKQDPETYKIIKLEPVDDSPIVAPQMHICLMCKHKSPSPEELDAHVKVQHAEAVKTEIASLDEEIARKAKGKKSA